MGSVNRVDDDGVQELNWRTAKFRSEQRGSFKAGGCAITELYATAAAAAAAAAATGCGHDSASWCWFEAFDHPRQRVATPSRCSIHICMRWRPRDPSVLALQFHRHQSYYYSAAAAGARKDEAASHVLPTDRVNNYLVALARSVHQSHPIHLFTAASDLCLISASEVIEGGSRTRPQPAIDHYGAASTFHDDNICETRFSMHCTSCLELTTANCSQ